MMAPTASIAKARHLIRKEYGKRHEIARYCIDCLTAGAATAANDYEGINELPINSNTDKVLLGSTKQHDNVHNRSTSTGVPTTEMDGKERLV